ncbi:MAG: MBOAT family protein [Candidatus Zixiibacteriota bacterium]|nr:MAG: MBOAT family protein [candidate division Zixibacteria bacterium]
MNFATVQYFVFFIVVFLIYWRLSRRMQNIFLLAASYFFYACWDWRFLSLIIVSTLNDYLCGMFIADTDSPRRRKTLLVISLVVNLGILGYFKYFNFFAGSFIGLADALGMHVSWTTARIILPVGISFYTFQSISYTVDIYRRQLLPTRSAIDFAAFVAFFPQLVAGPIVRAKEFVFQLKQKRHFSAENLQIGVTRFLTGYFKKAFVADSLAVYLVDPVFANPGDHTTGMLWLAMVAWTVQIYADFSGYSSMAIGSARMLGFEIPENFDFPYLSRNISEYWRRWHMTMSRFFRDYVYIGLGGNRRGTARSLLNIAVTTFVSGLWHGAGWTFVIWGWLHGLYIAVFHSMRKWRSRHGRYDENPRLPKIIAAWVLTQFAVCLALVLFRAPDFSTAWVYTKGLFYSAGQGTLEIPFLIWIAFASIIVDHIAGWIMEHRPQMKVRVPAFSRAVVYAAMIVFLYHAVPESVNPYIYFQF